MTNCYSQYMMHGLHAKECLTIDNAPVQLRPLSTVAQYFHLARDTLSTVYGICYCQCVGRVLKWPAVRGSRPHGVPNDSRSEDSRCCGGGEVAGWLACRFGIDRLAPTSGGCPVSSSWHDQQLSLGRPGPAPTSPRWDQHHRRADGWWQHRDR